MKYRFYLEGAEVHPVYGDDLSLTYKREDGRIYFRKELTELKFRNYKDWTDYDTIMAFDDDREINLIVRTDCDDYVADWWVGYFGKFDGDVDEDVCTFSVKPTVDDDYTCLEHHEDDEINVLNVSEEYDVGVDFTSLEIRTCTGTITLQTVPPRTGGYTRNPVGPTYTFTDSGGGSPLAQMPWGARISDVKSVHITKAYPKANSKNVNNFNCLDGLASSAGGVPEDHGFFAHSTVFTTDDGLTGGANNERDFTATTVWVREVIWTIDIDGLPTLPDASGTWGTAADFVDSMTVGGVRLHKWGREAFDMLNDFTLSGNTLPVSYTYDDPIPTDEVAIPHFRPLNSVIDFMMTEIDCGLVYRSTFFDNDDLPSDAPADVEAVITAASGDNYVTEEPNKLNYLMIAQKSDVFTELESSDEYQQATRGILTLKRLIDQLHNMFNVYAYVDVDGFFRIEHIRMFGQVLGTINLTTLRDNFSNELWERGTMKYSWDRGDMPGEEVWEFMEQNNPDFLGEPITYDEIESNIRIKKLIKEFNVPEVTTDIMFIKQVADGTLNGPISTDGFVILQCSYDGSYTCDNEEGIISLVDMPNGHLSVANLQDAYWRWDRVLLVGEMNRDYYDGTTTTFESYRRTREQVEVAFDQCCTEFDEKDLILTSLGNGEVVSAIFNLNTGMMRVKLRYL